MSKKSRDWSPDQTWLLPPSPRDWLGENHLVYSLLEVVGEMDLTPFFERDKNSVTGHPPFHPRMMVTLQHYGYRKGNLEQMQSLFVQTLQVCAEAGALKLGEWRWTVRKSRQTHRGTKPGATIVSRRNQNVCSRKPLT